MSVQTEDTTPLVWTSVGIARQQNIVAAAQKNLRDYVADSTNVRGGEVSLPDGERSDLHALAGTKGVLMTTHHEAKNLLARLRPAPRITKPVRASTNVVVTVEYLDDEMVRKRGTTETFLLGGIGESDTDSKLRTLSVDSPMGKAVKGKEVGDVARVLTPADGHFDMEIKELVGLETFLESGACTFDGTKLQLVEGTTAA